MRMGHIEAADHIQTPSELRRHNARHQPRLASDDLLGVAQLLGGRGLGNLDFLGSGRVSGYDLPVTAAFFPHVYA